MEILERIEDLQGVAYPDPPEGLLSFSISDMDRTATWERIESFCAWRWSVRPVRWTIAGPGEFKPDLAPATITAQEIWGGTAWIAASLAETAMGGRELTGEGPFRITAEVGTTEIPAGVWEAFRRLAEYCEEPARVHGAGRYQFTVGELTESFDRNPKWLAQAIHLSGAADLLRKYRRAP